MRKKVTLKQLAKELNLSISTVSKSLKNDSEISQKTTDRVHELASFYNYRPNALAVSLKSNITKTIGVLLPKISNPFFAKILSGIEQEATKNGYKIVTCITNESYEKEVEYIEMLNYSSVDGFILSLSKETQQLNILDHLMELKRDQIPLVLFDRVSNDIPCDKVIVDDKNGAKAAVNHLITIGCKRIAVISRVFDLSVWKLRLEGAREAVLAHHEVTLIELHITDKTTIENDIESFLRDTEIDGIFALEEEEAVTAINMATKLGYKVPTDISIIGFSDGLLSKYSYPKLTTVSQHAQSMGQQSVAVLIKQLEGVETYHKHQTTIVKTSLIIRDSTK